MLGERKSGDDVYVVDRGHEKEERVGEQRKLVSTFGIIWLPPLRFSHSLSRSNGSDSCLAICKNMMHRSFPVGLNLHYPISRSRSFYLPIMIPAPLLCPIELLVIRLAQGSPD